MNNQLKEMGMRTWIRVMWGLIGIVCVVSLFGMFSDLGNAASAPQQCAAAAITAAISVTLYVVGRAIGEVIG